MSVINQMLRDLELRRTIDTDTHYLLSGKGIHTRNGQALKRVLISLLLALMALSLAYLLWERFSAPPSPAPTGTASAASTPTAPSPPKPTAAPAQPPVTATARPVLKPVPVKPMTAVSSVPPATLQTKAQTPKPVALLETIEPMNVVGSWQPQTFTLRGRDLPSQPQIKVSWRNGEKILAAKQIQRHDSEHLTITLTTGIDADSWRVSLIDTDNQTVTFRVTAPPVVTQPHAAATDEPVDEANGDIEKRIRPIPPEQRAEQHYQDGYRLLQHGNQSGAEKAWRSALQVFPAHLPSREGLAGLYINQGRNVEAGELLAEGLKHHPGQGTFALLYARIQLQNGQEKNAIAILEQAQEKNQQNADFYAFLAALYQRQKAYEKSVAAYRQALALQPSQSVWWMGTGISQEGAGNTKAAIKAYEEALQRGNLTKKLQRYVEGRLQALQ